MAPASAPSRRGLAWLCLVGALLSRWEAPAGAAPAAAGDRALRRLVAPSERNLARATRRDMRRMLDPALRGREPRLPEYRRIAGYAARVLRAAGVSPLGGASARGEAAYFHAFEWGARAKDPGGASVNVVGLRPGRVPSRRATLVVAHLDHIEGMGGANDNASGSSAALRVARALRGTPIDKNVVFLLSSAEEKGKLGAEAFVRDRVARRAGYEIDEVINFDMVGDGPADRLHVLGGPDGRFAENNPLFGRVLALGRAAGLGVLSGHETKIGRFTHTDTLVLAQEGIPSVYVTGDRDSPYHSPEDTLEKVNLSKIGAAARLATETIRASAVAPPGARLPAGRQITPRRLRALLRTDAATAPRIAGGAQVRLRRRSPGGRLVADLIEHGPRVTPLVIDPESGAVRPYPDAGLAATPEAVVALLGSKGRLPEGAHATVTALSRSGSSWHVVLTGADGATSALRVDRRSGRIRREAHATTPR